MGLRWERRGEQKAGISGRCGIVIPVGNPNASLIFLMTLLEELQAQQQTERERLPGSSIALPEREARELEQWHKASAQVALASSRSPEICRFLGSNPLHVPWKTFGDKPQALHAPISEKDLGGMSAKMFFLAQALLCGLFFRKGKLL